MWISNFLALATAIAIASGSAYSEILPPGAAGRDFSNAEPLKLMFVGDSITHGHEADFTWRYRMWEWLRDSGTSFKFVGPYTGTCAPAPDGPPQPPRLLEDPVLGYDSVDTFPRIDWGYAKDASKDFDPHHFATSGDRADRVKNHIEDRVREYQPDMILMLLGFNDLSWGGARPEELIVSQKALIDGARKVNPSIKFNVGNVVHEAYSDSDLEGRTTMYNELLKSTYESWSTPGSPVHHVEVAGVYTCGPDRNCTSTADGLHPNELGAYQIAHAFSKTLIEHFSVGQEPIPIPSTWTERPVVPPTNVRASSSPMGIKLTWDRPLGITDFHVRRRTSDEEWIMNYKVQANRTETILPRAGIQYEYQVRSCLGRRCGDWTESVSAVSDRSTSPPPENVLITPTDLGFHVTWSPPKDAERWNIKQYDISFYNRNTTVAVQAGTRKLFATLEGLPSGQFSIVGNVMDVGVAVWTSPAGRSFYTAAKPVMPGAVHTPSAPTELESQMANGTAVYMKWKPSEHAAGYLTYVDGRTDGVVTNATEQFLTVNKAVENSAQLDMCISAINGENESEQVCLSGKTRSRPTPHRERYTAFFTDFVAVSFLAAVLVFALRYRKHIKDGFRGVYTRVPSA
ncbi:Putative fibronectin type III, immunoglobulin-like, SGNH hydrolase-type esterase [Septoria linicola]|uniref:Fibronectin type III, immunoglobulin-like, SGNH hydrolase-type esterase n=1 Tax=Septoria linicola TaxID=215465 RepID=A0A9Q9ATU4_9PEZI|nr:putative fibronectin type III, immunoglobulin-like, SGNH hydrolase-type esterase [Septoria linicola]USW53078.1 Putative fibronectin type III, immunoglobulin-like, SGNH hydrolase-type esterase [Septoria linicola]